MRYRIPAVFVLCAWSFLGSSLAAQGRTGVLDITVRITATGARPEPVREFSLYVLAKSYGEIIKEAGAQDALPTREQFIDNLKVTPELKDWMRAHDVIDLDAPDIDKLITADDIILVPEFLAAYQRVNSGGVTAGLPNPKFTDTDKDANPEKYAKQKQEYITSLKKFIQSHQSTISGIELELAAVNPKLQWDKLHNEHAKKIAGLAPEIAQTKYLVGKADTDLDGRALLTGLPPGAFWVSSLDMPAASGDRRLRWDVPVKVQSGQTTRLDLSNLNGTDANTTQP